MKRSDALEKIHRDIAGREKGYRAQALKLFPHVCASCGRSFQGKDLKSLTVHHKDHNHDYNPPDGSNWELLCLYCHDHEHEKHKMKGFSDGRSEQGFRSGGFTAFEKLDQLIKPNGNHDN